jgi:hypothetical protein
MLWDEGMASKEKAISQQILIHGGSVWVSMI